MLEREVVLAETRCRFTNMLTNMEYRTKLATIIKQGMEVYAEAYV